MCIRRFVDSSTGEVFKQLIALFIAVWNEKEQQMPHIAKKRLIRKKLKHPN